MVSVARQQRFGALFGSLDRNGDGYIDGSDYEGVVAMLARRRDLQPGAPDYDAMRSTILGGWDAVRELGDADGDGRVTRDEFVACLDTLAGSPEGLDRVAISVADHMITAMDADGDGRLDLDEYKGMMAAWGAPADRAEVMFGVNDTDGDGYVTREELLASVRGFFYDEDPAAPHLYGTPEV